jgi:hypothetical protein
VSTRGKNNINIWLPVITNPLQADKKAHKISDVFTSDDATVNLGVGKNMVAAIRYWLTATIEFFSIYVVHTFLKLPEYPFLRFFLTPSNYFHLHKIKKHFLQRYSSDTS